MVGHPLSSDRSNNELYEKRKVNNRRSTIILKSITPKSFYYINYNPDNEEGQFIDRIEKIDDVLSRHIEFLNDAFDYILEQCFKEVQREILKYEKFVSNYFIKKIPLIASFNCWFKQYINTTSFELDTLKYCHANKQEHKKYEVYLVEFERFIIKSYLEFIGRIKSIYFKYKKICSHGYNIEFNIDLSERLIALREDADSYFPKSDIHTIVHDLRDISKPFNDLWNQGFSQLLEIFKNKTEVISELNQLESLKSDSVEYELSYRYIRFLVGYSEFE